MGKKQHQRPTDDFCVTSVAWELENEATHRAAGFDPVPRTSIIRRFHQFIALLAREKMLTTPVALRVEDVTEETELRNRHLTDDGFEFVRLYHGKWLNRMYKHAGESKEQEFLEKWLVQFRGRTASH